MYSTVSEEESVLAESPTGTGPRFDRIGPERTCTGAAMMVSVIGRPQQSLQLRRPHGTGRTCRGSRQRSFRSPPPVRRHPASADFLSSALRIELQQAREHLGVHDKKVRFLPYAGYRASADRPIPRVGGLRPCPRRS